jgi:sugar transferase (PEP-CTERM/EpsH1 system associated)
MRILFLCHRLPYPPKRGGKIRPFNMIRHLSRNHDVTVATIARSAEDLAAGQQLRKYCQELHVGYVSASRGWARLGLSIASGYPATFSYFYSPDLARTVKRLLSVGKVDAVLVHCSSMGPYVAGHRGPRMIMDFGDADSEKWFEYGRSASWPLAAGFRWEGRKVREYERRLGAAFDACSVSAPRERDVLAGYVSTPIHVIPNGVDLEYFRRRGPAGVSCAPCRVIFTGNMSYRPNVEAVRYMAEEILPRVRREVPEVEFQIVGMDPTPAVRKLADGRRVVVTGRVEDVRPYFEGAAVAVAPLRVARGLQNKVLEAMAMRVPVVASPAAAQGISAAAGRDLVVAADPDGFSAEVTALLRQPEVREAYANAGRACVEANHNWDDLLRSLEELVTGVSKDDRRVTGGSRL